MSALVLFSAVLAAEVAINEFNERCILPIANGQRPVTSDLEQVDPEEWARLQEGSKGAAYRIREGLFLELKSSGSGDQRALTCSVSPAHLEGVEMDYEALHSAWEAGLSALLENPSITPFLPCETAPYTVYSGFEALQGPTKMRGYMVTHVPSEVFLFVVLITPELPPDNCAEGAGG